MKKIGKFKIPLIILTIALIAVFYIPSSIKNTIRTKRIIARVGGIAKIEEESTKFFQAMDSVAENLSFFGPEGAINNYPTLLALGDVHYYDRAKEDLPASLLARRYYHHFDVYFILVFDPRENLDNLPTGYRKIEGNIYLHD